MVREECERGGGWRFSCVMIMDEGYGRGRKGLSRCSREGGEVVGGGGGF